MNLISTMLGFIGRKIKNLETEVGKINSTLDDVSPAPKVIPVERGGTGATTIEDARKALSIHPVGSIYMSVNSTDPSTLFGGVWEQIQDTFLLASGNSYGAGRTGGSARATLPAHTHTFGSGDYQCWLAKSEKGSTEPGNQISGDTKYYAAATGGSTNNYKWISRVDSNGTQDVSQANMPPYLAVYVWKRIA